MVMSTRSGTTGNTGDQFKNIGQAFPDFVRFQLKGDCAIVVNSTERRKKGLEVNHPFTGREMQVVRVGIPSSIIMDVNVFDSIRVPLDKAKAPVFLAKKLSVAQIKRHHQRGNLNESRFQVPRLFTQVFNANRDLIFGGLVHDSLENLPLGFQGVLPDKAPIQPEVNGQDLHGEALHDREEFEDLREIDLLERFHIVGVAFLRPMAKVVEAQARLKPLVEVDKRRKLGGMVNGDFGKLKPKIVKGGHVFRASCRPT